MPLLEHQRPSVAAVAKHFRSRQAVKWGERDIHPPIVVNASVSSGKSVMIAELAKAVREAAMAREKPASVLVLVVQRQGELCEQNSAAAWDIKLNNSVYSASVGGRKSTRYQVVYSTEGTLARALETYRFSPYTPEEMALPAERRALLGKFHPDLMLWDECFAPGSMIDGLPIELVKVGDMVRSFNHESGAQELREVKRLYRSKPKTLCAVYLNDGRSFLCTENHPFFTMDNGYVCASDLESGSPVTSMHDMRQSVLNGSCSQLAAIPGEGKGLLLEGVRERISPEVSEHPYCEDQSRACFGQDEAEKPHAQGGDSSKGIEFIEGHRSCSASQDGQWIAAATASAENVPASGSGGFPAEDGACGYGRREARGRLADTLQAGRVNSGSAPLPGNGRPESLQSGQKETGRKEGSVLDFARVDRVEIFKSTSDGTFGGMLPGGHVYNFEVEGNHNYFVDGILVHNCHQIPYDNPESQAFKIINHFLDCRPHMRFAGFSGSPFRDILPIIGDTTGHFFRSFACIEPDDPDYPEGGVGNGIISTEFMIEQGWVVPPMFGWPDEDDKVYDFSHIDPKGWEYDEAELDAVVSDHERLMAICADLIEKSAERKGVLVFAATQRHARQIAAAMKAQGIPAEQIGVITDKTKAKDRRRILDEAKTGVIKYTINVAVLTTGVNVPWWDTLAFLRPIGSLVLLIQAIGRVLRLLIKDGDVPMLERSNLCGMTAEDRLALIAASDKPNALVLDYADVMSRLGNLYENPVLEQAELEKAKKKNEDLIQCQKCYTMNSPHARRCIGRDEHGERCDFFWHSRVCPSCRTENDQVARECRNKECRRMLIDPNAALNGKSYSDAESTPVRSMQVGDGAGGKIWFRYELSDGRTPIEIYYPHAGKQKVLNSKVWAGFVSQLPISQRDKFRLSAMKASTIMENLELIPAPSEISAREKGGRWTIGRRKFAEEESFMEATA